MGKTDLTLNAIGHCLDDDPRPIIYVGPSKNFVESRFEPRLTAMLRGTPSLWSKTVQGKKNKKCHKTVSGVDVFLGWAGSATELAGASCALALIDELDRMDGDVQGEGDPLALVEARGATFPDFKLIVTSTPLIGNVDAAPHPMTGLTHWQPAEPSDLESPTWRAWQEGTRHEWTWPCPECGVYFVPRSGLLRWPDDAATPSVVARSAWLECPHCQSPIAEHHKTRMNAAGRMVAPGQSVCADGVVGGPDPDGDTGSFWISGLCSPWTTWGRLAKAHVEAVRSGDPGRIQGVANTAFGELYRVGAAQARPADELARRLRGTYPSDSVPAGALVLVAGIDVHKSRLNYVIRAFGHRMESWLVRHGELFGETEHDAIWGDLGALLDADLGGHRIKLMLVDSGYKPGERWRTPDHKVYEFTRLHADRVRACKGHDRQSKPIQAADVDITFRGRLIKNGLKLWHLDSDYFKSWVVQRFDWPADQPGGWHVPCDATDDYFAQLTAEVRTVKASGAVVWQQLRRDNHFLDCEALATAAAQMLGTHLLKPPPEPGAPAPPVAGRPPGPIRSKYISG